jgi:hypothetical protein
MAKDSDILQEAQEAFKRASEAESVNRDNWLSDMRFARMGEQWPEEVRRQRELEGRPCLTNNKLPTFIRQVTNDARQNRPAIKTHPVGDGADKATSEVLNGLIRNIEYTSNADVAYDTALDHAVTSGFGYFRISTDYACEDAFDQDILIEPIANPLTVYGDPASTAADSSDWNRAFVTEMWDRDEFEKKWKGAEPSDFQADDKNQAWFTDKQVRVAEYWTREEVDAKVLRLSNGIILFEPEYIKMRDFFEVQGLMVVGDRPTKTKKVTQRIITGAEVLETNKWAGRYIPIVPVYGDTVMIEGERHFVSLIRFAKDAQMMHNFWRTASTELVALAPKMPFIGARGSFNSDAEKWATANNVSHAYVEYDVVEGAAPPQRQAFSGPPAGALQEALNAADDMKSIMGIYDASLGARSNETSGRAIMARQREGDISTFNYIDNLSRAIRHAGRIIVDLIPKVYNAPRIIRVIGEDGTNENVPVNQPLPPEQQQAQKEQAEGIARIYDLTTGKYDVTCEAGPSFTTKREEAANQMIEFIRANPASAGLIGDLLAKNLDWPGADEIAERMKAMLPPQVQGPNPQIQAMQQQMQQMDGQAKQAIQQLQQQLAQVEEDKRLEWAKVNIDDKNAETNRLKVVGTAMTPEQVQMLVMQTLQQVLAPPDIQQMPIQPNPPSAGFFPPEGIQP